jgi:hypothetical protein
MEVIMDGVSQNYQVTQMTNNDLCINTKPILIPLGNNAKRKITLELGGTSGTHKICTAPLSVMQTYLQDPVSSTLKWNKESGGKFYCIQKNDVLIKLRCAGLALQEGITSRGSTRENCVQEIF